MTAPVRNTNDPSITPFGRWLHEQSELDSRKYQLNIQNVDYVIYRGDKVNKRAYLMFVEEKRFNAEPNTAQDIMMNVLTVILNFAHGLVAKIFGGQRVLWLGYHVIVFENDTPENGRMWWNGEQVTRQQLIELIRFDVDPRKVGKRRAS